MNNHSKSSFFAVVKKIKELYCSLSNDFRESWVEEAEEILETSILVQTKEGRKKLKEMREENKRSFKKIVKKAEERLRRKEVIPTFKEIVGFDPDDPVIKKQDKNSHQAIKLYEELSMEEKKEVLAQIKKISD